MQAPHRSFLELLSHMATRWMAETQSFSSNSGARSPRSRCQEDQAPTWGSRGGSFLPPPALGAPGFPGLWPHPSHLCLSLHSAPPLYVSLFQISLCFLFQGLLSLDLGPTLNAG